MTQVTNGVAGAGAPRLRLQAHPTAVAALTAALPHLAGAHLAVAPAGVADPAFIGVTAGLHLCRNPDLLPSRWQLDADGRTLLSGTVTSP